MKTLIEGALSRARTVFIFLVLIIVTGTIAFRVIPKEAQPDVSFPYVYVSMVHEGISPEDAERLLVRPMETQLRSIEGVEEIRATAREGGAAVTMEFNPAVDLTAALADVREKVDLAAAELPEDTLEPTVHEISSSNIPSIVVALSGGVPERTLNQLAENLRQDIESIPDVLEANIRGMREDLLEVVIDPTKLEAYNISQNDLLSIVLRNNSLIAAGVLDTGSARFSVKVPGLVESPRDVLALPIKVGENAAVTLADIGTVRRTFKDRTSYSRVDGEPAITVDVLKRGGANAIQISETVRRIVEEHRATWPRGVTATYPTDMSVYVKRNLSSLRNSVITAILLVAIVVVAALGGRSALLVGLSIPTSFLAAFLFLWITGATLNNVVLFGLVLAVGMLVDGAIVVTEYADRKMLEGHNRRQAYGMAAERMAWPILSSTATTLAAFFPMIFWPGIMGEIMQYLPLTMVVILLASLVSALIFLPVVGAAIGGPSENDAAVLRTLAAQDKSDVRQLPGLTGLYARFIDRVIRYPFRVLAGGIAVLLTVWIGYSIVGQGIVVFPPTEPDTVDLQVRARGNLSIEEKDRLVREVESIALGIPDVATVYARTDSGRPSGGVGQSVPRDRIGQVSLELKEWENRRPAFEVIDAVRRQTARLAGIIVEPSWESFGPPSGKDIEVQIASRFPEMIPPLASKLRAYMESNLQGLTDVSDTLPLPGIEWAVEVDRAQAGRFGADIAAVGGAVQMVTNGVKVGEYRPNDATEEVDIRVRFPREDRTLNQLDMLRVQTTDGLVPISNFVSRVPRQQVDIIERVDGMRVITVAANTAPGVLAYEKVQEIQAWLDSQDLDPRMHITFLGEDEQRRETAAFLGGAFLLSLFLMAIILVTQFNSFYHALLILSSVVMSTIGVVLGLIVTGRPFSVVLTGIGVVALAGIVVNNNIVLIDTFQRFRKSGMALKEAILRTSTQRFRPVLLTTLTTIAGLFPMMMGASIDFVSRTFVIGAPEAQLWVDVAMAIVFGLSFATVLTLIVTPCLLAAPEILHERVAQIRSRLPWRRGHQPAE